jgi:hypothetical protein
MIFYETYMLHLLIINIIDFRTEKNACAWSQDKIKELFTDIIIERDGCE